MQTKATTPQPQLQQQTASLHTDGVVAAVAVEVMMAVEVVVAVGSMVEEAEAEEKKEKKSGITVHTTAGCGQHTGKEGATPGTTPNPTKTCSPPALPGHFWDQFPDTKTND